MLLMSDRVSTRTASFRTPYLSGDKGKSTPIKTQNVTVDKSQIISIYPERKTSRLGIFALLTSLAAVVPLLLYTMINVIPGKGSIDVTISWFIAILVTLVPVVIYMLMQRDNRIVISPDEGILRYRTALGTSVSFYIGEQTRSDFFIAYFSNTTAQSRFNHKGWACFYRGDEMMFRLNMERWDVQDLWWLSENLPARIMLIHERKGFKYVEKHFKDYYPMFASKPVLSGILIILGIAFGITTELMLWALALHV
jgi:hypothetical protein